MLRIRRHLNPNSITLAGSKLLVADRFEACRRPASNLSATSFQPASVMEFGFYSQITFSLSLWIWQLGKWMASTVKQRNVNSQLTR